MPKIAIITVGFTEFAFPPKVDAAKVLAALSQAEEVDHSYDATKGTVYFPVDPKRRSRELKLTFADSRQILSSAPEKDDDDGPLRPNP